MSATETITQTIEASHIRAMKHADTIVMRLADGQGQIEMIRRANNSVTGWDESQTIYVGASVKDYGRSDAYMAGERGDYTGFVYLGSMSVNETARTLIGRIRKGDKLTLAFVRSNQTENITAAGLVADELHLTIRRPNGTDEHYLVSYAVTLDNVARMIQRVR